MGGKFKILFTVKSKELIVEDSPNAILINSSYLLYYLKENTLKIIFNLFFFIFL